MKTLSIIIPLVLVSLISFGQVRKSADANKYYKTSDSALTASANRNRVSKATIVNAVANTPIRSALTYNTLVQYFQSTVTGGANGGFNFKSSLFGLKYLFSGTKNDSLSGYYLTHWADRNTEISFGLNKAKKTNDQLSIITLGYKIAILNGRDKSVVNFAKVDSGIGMGIDSANHAISRANHIYIGKSVLRLLRTESIAYADKNKAISAAEVMDASNRKWTDDQFKSIFKNTSIDTNGCVYLILEQKFNTALRSTATLQKNYINGESLPSEDEEYKTIADSVFSSLGTTYAKLHKNLQDEYDRYAKKIEKGDLLTFSINLGYNIQYHHSDSSSLAIRYLKGLGNYKKPWNIDFQAILVSLQDSSANPRNFAHNKLKFILGANKVFALDDKSNPLLESELAAEYDKVISGRYSRERKDVFTFNLITNIHLSKEFTLPLTLKYDVKKPNLFGFLSLQWNLEGKGAN
jgi:hypothetical protein